MQYKNKGPPKRSHECDKLEVANLILHFYMKS